ncbi:MAG: ATP-binding protein [Bacteroidia bacterium]
MNQVFKNKAYWILFALTLLFTIGGNVIENKYEIITKNSALGYFEKNLLKAEKQALNLLEELTENSFEQNQINFKQHEKKYLKYGIAFYVYRQDSLKLWSNIEALPPFYFTEFYRPTLHQTDNGSYVFFVKSSGNYHYIVSINLSHHYLFSNKYLVDNSPVYPGFSKYFRVGKPQEFQTKIALSSGQIICSVKQKEIKAQNKTFGYLTYTLLLLCILLAGNKVTRIATVSILYLLIKLFDINSAVNQIGVFDVSIYAGIFGNLGDLIFGIILLKNVVDVFKLPIVKSILRHILLIASPILIYDLVVNSIIIIDTANTLQISFYSILVFIALALHYSIIAKLATSQSKIETWLSILFLCAAVLIAVFTPISIVILAYPIVAYLISQYAQKFSEQVFIKGVFLFLMASLAFAQVEYLTYKKTQKQLPILVKNIVNQRDNVAEFLISDFRKNLSADPYVFSFFTNSFLPKSTVQERLEKLYLRGYLKKFEHQILFAPRKLRFGLAPEPALVDRVNSILQKENNQISEGIYSAKLAGISNAYLTEQHIENNSDTIGSLYVLLTEKSFYDQSIYPELLIGENEAKPNSQLNFALYENSELKTSVGALSYPLFYKGNKEKLDYQLNKNFEHLFYTPDKQTVFVVSTKKRTWLNYLSSYSIFVFLLVLFGFVAVFGKEILYALLHVKLVWHKTSFSTRVRISAIGAVLLALILLSYATTIYTQTKYEQETLESLVNKAKKAKLNFSSLFNQFNNNNLSNDELQEQVLQFSEHYEADIDVFSAHGKLLASSQKILYDNGILEDQIDGTAFYEIAINGKSLFVKDEKIGELKYITAYVPIVKNRHIDGFVQLPYFKRQQDLRKDQANFIVTLFNIYLIILVLLAFLTAIILRTITRPLTLITSQLKNTSLTGNNEKIVWERNDEIGLLVKEYNEMVDKLAISAKQLADSKQAEAWQEMARQVAHEIKNPLTPMKLNIQQLQRAWKDQHHSLEKIFNKVTGILINQIESLAKIATDFSSFAKMPKLKLEKVDLFETIEQIQQLYNTDSETVFLNTNGNDFIINGDKDQLFRAINNVVKNGIQAVENEVVAKITIMLSSDLNQFKIQIIDNGVGINDKMKEKIFIPNFSTKSSGMGLGLAIVKQIIENHGGSISFKPNNQGGTRFIILLPMQ